MAWLDRQLRSFVLVIFLGSNLLACGGSSPGTGTTGIADTSSPSISATTPANGATDVSISSALTLTFSEPVDPTTLTGTTVSINPPVTGFITVTGVTAMFAPSASFAPSTFYAVTLTTGIKDLAGNALASPSTWSFTTGAAPDLTPPTVSNTSPPSGAVNVSISSALTATFSEPIDPATVTPATFTLNPSVGGTRSVIGTTATFTPTGSLAGMTTYTATLTTGIKDLAGNPLATPYNWTFTMGNFPDTTPPTVSATSPTNGAANVSPSSALTATFSEPVDPLTVTAATFTLKDSANNPVTGNITTNGTTVTFALPPGTPLNGGATYTATLTTGIKDLAGNALLTSFSWSFTTTAAPDTTPPTVGTTTPANNDVGVSISSALTAIFSEPINPATVTAATFTLNPSVGGTRSVIGTTATFTPTSPLAGMTTYTATLTTGIKDLAGNALASPHSWTFTTQAGAPPSFGLDWPGDGAVRRMLYWHNPFPIYDATYIFKVYPRKKTSGCCRYYTTFFWGNDGSFAWDGGNANTYYGMHPYPVPPPTGSGQWEISVASNDFTTGTEVEWDRWYTQAVRVWRESASVTHHEFYWDWPNMSRVIEHTVSDPGWANQNPPTPAIVMGQAPNVGGVSWGGYAGWEEFNGIIRGIQIYSGLLSLSDIQGEINAPQSTTAGQNFIWYRNLNPTPIDTSDKSGQGHHPSWDGIGRPTLYVGP